MPATTGSPDSTVIAARSLVSIARSVVTDARVGLRRVGQRLLHERNAPKASFAALEAPIMARWSSRAPADRRASPGDCPLRQRREGQRLDGERLRRRQWRHDAGDTLLEDDREGAGHHERPLGIALPFLARRGLQFGGLHRRIAKVPGHALEARRPGPEMRRTTSPAGSLTVRMISGFSSWPRRAAPPTRGT